MTDDLIGEVSRREEIETLLFDHLPNHRNKANTGLNSKKLWEDLEMTRQGLNFWFTRERIAVTQVKKLIELEGSTLTYELLMPFTVADE